MSTKQTQAETRDFRLHKNILLDIIFSQAGTLSKAILEGVMNAIDAGAKNCYINASFTEVKISDDGQGIQKRQEIEDWFEEFGHPHEQQEKKVFGKFRMGRGQLFAFGANHWRTGPFEMLIDIKNDGLKYDLLAGQPLTKGCQIDVKLYEKLTPSAYSDVERTVAEWVKYAPIAIYWNDERVTVDVAAEKWDHVLPEAYIKLKQNGSLSIFNLGIHTMELPSWRFGTAGVIVSREQLKVNFARNDVVESCPVWRKIKPFVQLKSAERISKKTTKLTSAELEKSCDRLRNGELDRHEFADLRLFTTVEGRQISYKQLMNYRTGYKVSACEAGDALGAQLHRAKVAMVLTDETLERFRVKNVEGLLKLLAKSKPKDCHIYGDLVAIDFDTLSEGQDRDYVILDDKALTPTERMWLDLIARTKHKLALSVEGDNSHRAQQASFRRVLIGVGPAEGWTDGNSYVVISRDWLGQRDLTLRGFTVVGTLLLDLFCCSNHETLGSEREESFYQLFHASIDALGHFVTDCMIKAPLVVKAADRQMSRKQLADQDRAARVGDLTVTAQ